MRNISQGTGEKSQVEAWVQCCQNLSQQQTLQVCFTNNYITVLYVKRNSYMDRMSDMKKSFATLSISL